MPLKNSAAFAYVVTLVTIAGEEHLSENQPETQTTQRGLFYER